MLDPAVLDDEMVLTLRGARFALVCIDGRCRDRLTEKSTGMRQIRLPPRQVVAGGMPPSNIVWFIGTERGMPLGLLLDEGILVASTKDLFTATYLYSLYKFSPLMRPITWYLALLMMAIPIALVYRRFADYPSMVLLAASLVFWASSRFVMMVIPAMRMTLIHPHYLLTHLILLMAVLNHCLATIRLPRPKRRKILLVGAAIACLGLIGAFIATSKFNVPWTTISHSSALPVAGLLVVASIGVLLYGLLELQTKIDRLGPSDRVSSGWDLHRRRTETFFHMVCWGGFVGSCFHRALLSLGKDNLVEFNGFGLASLLGLFGTTLYFTFSKDRTHMRTEPVGELDRQRKRLDPLEFEQRLAKPRSGVLLIADLSKSSALEDKAKQLVMNELLRAIVEDLARFGRYPAIANPGGDDWKIVVEPRSGEPLSEVLLALARMLQQSSAAYVRSIQQHFPKCGLHLTLIAMGEYSVSWDPQAVKRGLVPILDFGSRWVNFAMKLAGQDGGKSPLPESILIVASSDDLPESLGFEALPLLTDGRRCITVKEWASLKKPAALSGLSHEQLPVFTALNLVMIAVKDKPQDELNRAS